MNKIKIKNNMNWFKIEFQFVTNDESSAEKTKCITIPYYNILESEEESVKAVEQILINSADSIYEGTRRLAIVTMKTNSLRLYKITYLNQDGQCILTEYYDSDLNVKKTHYVVQ